MIAVIIILCIFGLLVWVVGSMYIQNRQNSRDLKFQNLFYVEKCKLIVQTITYIFFIAGLVAIGILQIQIHRIKMVYSLTFIMALFGLIGICSLNFGKIYLLNQRLKSIPKFQNEDVIRRYEKNIKYISYPFILATAIAFFIQQYIIH